MPRRSGSMRSTACACTMRSYAIQLPARAVLHTQLPADAARAQCRCLQATNHLCTPWGGASCWL